MPQVRVSTDQSRLFTTHLKVLTVVLELVHAQLGVSAARRRLLVHEDLEPLAVTHDLVDSRLNLVLDQVNVVAWQPDKVNVEGVAVVRGGITIFCHFA